MIFALKFFYTVTIRCGNYQLVTTLSYGNYQLVTTLSYGNYQLVTTLICYLSIGNNSVIW